jgi:hypothetical protein
MGEEGSLKILCKANYIYLDNDRYRGFNENLKKVSLLLG